MSERFALKLQRSEHKMQMNLFVIDKVNGVLDGFCGFLRSNENALHFVLLSSRSPIFA